MIYILLLLYFIAKTLYKSLIFAVFMPIKEKIANTYVSAILNSNVFMQLVIIAKKWK